MSYKRRNQTARSYGSTGRTTDGGCGEVKTPLGYTPLAMVYVVPQCWQGVQLDDGAFARGTIFDELYKPFNGYKNSKGGCRR